MKAHFRATLLAGLAMLVVFAGGAERMYGQVQITGGPTIERADGSSAVITWSTSQASSSRIWYGTNPNNLTELAEAPYSRGDGHRVEIRNLRPGTTYYFQLESQRGSTEAQGVGVMSFQTAGYGQPPIMNQSAQMAKQGSYENNGLRITQGPILEDVAAESATVAWSTNTEGSTRVTYGTDPNNLTQLAEAPWGANGHTHRAKLHNLQPNTTYYFRVETGQARGMQGAEAETQRVLSFRTTPQGAAPIHNERPR
jgi:phosphodiesterase/alkaline phosphatase D-like protein